VEQITTTSKLLNRIKTTLPRPVSTRNQRTTPAKTRETTHTTTVTTIRSTVLHTVEVLGQPVHANRPYQQQIKEEH
jgi:hypothetical protein